MNRPTISVCVVTYNQRDYIGTCLRSILDQKVDADVRVLVGDDASTDGTTEIVAQLAEEFPARVRHLPRQTNLGVFANVRGLLREADGDYLATVDGDDYWLPGKLARQLAFLQAHPDCAAVYTNAIAVDAKGCRFGLFNDVGDVQFNLAAMLRRGNFLNSSSGLTRAEGKRACLDIADPQIDYRAHLWHARHGWLGHIGEPLAAYRVNSQGSMVASMNDRVRELYWQAIQSVPRDRVSDDDYAHGLADFLRRVFFRSVRMRNWSLWRKWKSRVFHAAPCGASRLYVLTATNILRMAFKEAAGRFKRSENGKRLRVLYRR